VPAGGVHRWGEQASFADMLIVHAVRSLRPAQIIREQFLCSGRMRKKTHYDVDVLVDSAVIDSSIGREAIHFLP